MSDHRAGDGRGKAPEAPEDPDSAAAAEQTALRMLRGAAQSAAALQRRLQRRGFTEQAAVAATAAMVRFGYVDDAALAQSIAARSQRTGHGRIQMAAQLRSRGVDGDAIAATMADVDPEAEREAALALGRRLWDRGAPGRAAAERRQRVAAQLQRRGFDMDTVRWVFREVERQT
ncbi:MAG TPA: RecX family transcriptional regulator [Candidatus Dormibacteraeota bacterium]|jgi:regulatory protein|nr:RecX family transcriptional regulator [Candidatus Dormibacteraeota bacterium]